MRLNFAVEHVIATNGSHAVLHKALDRQQRIQSMAAVGVALRARCLREDALYTPAFSILPAPRNDPG